MKAFLDIMPNFVPSSLRSCVPSRRFMEREILISKYMQDLFISITKLLGTLDIVHSRSVSKTWYDVFTKENVLRSILAQDYNKAREVRTLLAKESPSSDIRAAEDVSSSTDQTEMSSGLSELRKDWRQAFDRVVARYCALQSGNPVSFTTHELRLPLRDPQTNEQHNSIQHGYYPIRRWDRYIVTPEHATDQDRLNGVTRVGTLPIDLEETDWTYDSGLLVYFELGLSAYVLLDIASNTRSAIPFDESGRVVRRLRLKHNLLMIEWAAYSSMNQIGDDAGFFATAYDVRLIQAAVARFRLPEWRVEFRSEWKLGTFGPSPRWQRRWLSTHSDTYYAAYIWQQGPSPSREHDTDESLLVWDISGSSQHPPSNAPSSECQSRVEPRLVKTLTNQDLDFLTIRQGRAPLLRNIALDDSTVYFFEEGCSIEQGWHVDDNRLNHITSHHWKDQYWERVVGVPILDPGPHWEDKCDSRSIVPVQTGQAQPKRATCWRYDGLYPELRNKVFNDELADIKFEVLQRHIRLGFPEIWVSSKTQGWKTKVELADFPFQWKDVCGDERWLIMQCSNELCILRFDWKPQTGNGSYDRLPHRRKQGPRAGTFPWKSPLVR
jgi:hypothetical protein